MSPARTGKVQITVRVEQELVQRLDALAAKLSRPGLALGRADAMRMAMEEGLKSLEAAGDNGENVGRKGARRG